MILVSIWICWCLIGICFRVCNRKHSWINHQGYKCLKVYIPIDFPCLKDKILSTFINFQTIISINILYNTVGSLYKLISVISFTFLMKISNNTKNIWITFVLNILSGARHSRKALTNEYEVVKNQLGNNKSIHIRSDVVTKWKIPKKGFYNIRRSMSLFNRIHVSDA